MLQATMPRTAPLPPRLSDNGNWLRTITIGLQMSRDPLQASLDLWRQHGDVFSFKVNGLPLHSFLMHPDHVQELLITHAKHIRKDATYTDTKQGLARFFGNGLLTSEGAFWRKQRKLAAPAFHATRVNAYAESMTRYASETLDGWQDGAELDIAHEMMLTTLKIISYTLLHQTDTNTAKRINEAMARIQQFAIQNFFIPLPFPTPSTLQARQARRMLDEVIYGVIRQRRADPSDRGDLLSMLLLTEDEDGNRMSDTEARDEAVTLFLAGHETTANTMNWTFKLLAENPEAEAKLHAELDSVLGGRAPTLADLRALPYTNAVIKEAMRLYPPAWSFSRELLTDLEIGGYHFPKGSVVILTSYITHRHPDFWEAPEAFRPERFLPENEGKIDKWAYIPFGGGQRVCIGQAFAMLEAALILATVASRYTLRLVPNRPIKRRAAITLYPEGGLPMTVHRR